MARAVKRADGRGGCAPLKKRVILPALAAILLLALAVCALHVQNAVSLRGTVPAGEYLLTDGAAESLVPLVEDPWMAYGVLHIRGALLRLNQPVGAVNVRVGLMAQDPETGAPAADEVILLNTQMVRRFGLAKTYGCDDHCGFSAAAQASRLAGGDTPYRVVLVDETDGEKRMIETDMTVTPGEDGLAFVRVHQPGEEAQDAQ